MNFYRPVLSYLGIAVMLLKAICEQIQHQQKKKKATWIITFEKKIPHNVQKCLIHFILLARNSVFVQFFEKNVIVLFLFQASIFKLFIGL